MPYGKIADLPGDASRLPAEASSLFLRVANSALAAGLAEGEACQVAWKGLANAGWTLGADSSWSRTGIKAFAPTALGGSAIGFKARVPILAMVPKGEGLRFFGVASRSLTERAELVRDKHSDIIEPQELSRAAYQAVKDGIGVDLEHGAFYGDGPEIGTLIESAYLDAEKRVAMGLDGTGPTEWWVGFEIQPTNDAAKAAIVGLKAGTHRELSIEYSARRDILPQDQPGATIWAKAVRAIIRSKDSAPAWGRPVGRLRDLRITRIGLVTAGAGEGVVVPLVKGKKEGSNMDLMEQLQALLATLPEEQQKLITAALAAASQGKQDAPPPEPPKMAPEVKALFEKQAAEAKTAQAKADAMAKELAEIKDAQELERFAKAADAMTWLPVERIAMAKTLRYIDGAPDEVKKNLKGLLETCDRLLKQSSVFESFGVVTPGGEQTRNASPYAKLRAKAEELRRADPKLAEHEAFIAACKANPEIYREHLNKARNAG